MVKCPNCKCGLVPIKGTNDFTTKVEDYTEETKEDIVRKKILRRKLIKLGEEVASLGEEIKKSNLNFPKKIQKEFDEMQKGKGELSWNWWEKVGTSIYQIMTPSQLSAVVGHFLEEGMIISSINEKCIYDRDKGKYNFGKTINKLSFNWK